MKSVSRTLGISAAIVLVVAALLLIGFILGWVSSEDLQTSLGKALAVTGVVIATVLGLIGITALLDKEN